MTHKLAKMVLGKKAQIRMVETIAVLIVFIFIVFIGYSFYSGWQKSSINAQLREINSRESVQIALKTYFMPELQCSFGTKLETTGCIDKIKFDKLSAMINDHSTPAVKNYYYGIFGNTEINLIKAYPFIQGQTNSNILYSSKISGSSYKRTQMPVSIYDPITKRYSFGYLQVDYYFS